MDIGNKLCTMWFVGAGSEQLCVQWTYLPSRQLLESWAKVSLHINSNMLLQCNTPCGLKYSLFISSLNDQYIGFFPESRVLNFTLLLWKKYSKMKKEISVSKATTFCSHRRLITQPVKSSYKRRSSKVTSLKLYPSVKWLVVAMLCLSRITLEWGQM
jgi:hypothetical protein